MKSIKAKVLKYNPQKVIIKLEDKGKVIEVARSVFEKRYEIGFYDVVNTEALPRYL